MTHIAIRNARELKRQKQLRYKLIRLSDKVDWLLDKEYEYMTAFETELLLEFNKKLNKLLFPNPKDRLK